MTSAEAESSDSPNASSFQRKNKLGYTRISVACAHCRRRKIRCVKEDGDEAGRCANCIRLKKECIFTNVDTNTASEGRTPTKSAFPSQPSSVLSSKSPSLMSPGRGDGSVHSSHSHPAMYGGVPGNVPTGRGLGGFLPPAHMHPDHSVIHRHGNHEWSAQPPLDAAGAYHSHQAGMQWQQQQSDSARNYPQNGFQTGPPAQLGFPTFLNHPRSDATTQDQPQTQWTTAGPASTAMYQPPIPPMTGFGSQPTREAFTAAYTSPAHASLASQPVLPSQYYAQRAVTNHGMTEHTAGGWPHPAQEPQLSASPRHDSMGTDWSRGGTYGAGNASVGYDARGQEQRYTKASMDHHPG